MKVVTLASGSKGNCTLISTDKTSILVDAGINITEIEGKLKIIGVEPSSIYAIVITHEHSDHIKNVGVFARKYGCLVIASEREWPVLEKKIGKLKTEQKISFSNHAIKLFGLKAAEFFVHCCDVVFSFLSLFKRRKAKVLLLHNFQPHVESVSCPKAQAINHYGAVKNLYLCLCRRNLVH